ncbi:urease accessory protein UreF [Cytophaga hutchinsonii]|jgi:urease accessory protein|uniref:Urease accessory protein UreF n=1 Tax=Cytophaga hutchinsonii (strain ATCC 33406 / DSM 1761 / CIP 103989 / NBRC 15051 / NCIMB 9469 / D465) TaxID=269798 RepID=A0A6N4SQH2_CYTH3|nr:urease accessory UreF family protein [Cytophaga hutchinsonii]ABG58534.1 urease accessory protein [Cytophaga hutchinsonii ATCC 33406]SFX76432.1 urease accessory protein [Cytophaga hutchinsonii ATCC 33406]
MISSKDNTHLFLLLQMADSAFPVGGFAYSYGLESAVKHNLISDGKGLREYLLTFSEQLIAFDFPFIAAAHQQSITSINIADLKSLLQVYKSMLLNPPLSKAGCVMGRNWLKICKQITNSYLMDETEEVFRKENLTFEFPIVFGLSMQASNFTLSQTLFLYFYMSIRDQISALIRLGSAGPSMAHTELQQVLHLFTIRIESYIPVHYSTAYKSAYLLELAQLSHDRVYSKLFQN